MVCTEQKKQSCALITSVTVSVDTAALMSNEALKSVGQKSNDLVLWPPMLKLMNSENAV